MPRLYPGEIATTRDGRTVVILTHVDTATGEPFPPRAEPTGDEQTTICRTVADGLPVGEALTYPTAELARAYLPVEQARTVYAAVNDVDVERFPMLVPDWPIGSREYAEYVCELFEELRRFKLCPACGAARSECKGRHTDSLLDATVEMHMRGEHSSCLATTCGPRPSIDELMRVRDQ